MGRAPVPGLILPFHRTGLGSSEGPGAWLPALYLLSPLVFQVLSGCFMWELGRSLKVRKGTSDQFCFSIPVHTLSPGRPATLSCVILVEMASRAVKRVKGLAPAVTDLCAVCALKFSTDGIFIGACVSQHLPYTPSTSVWQGLSLGLAIVFIHLLIRSCLFVCLNVRGGFACMYVSVQLCLMALEGSRFSEAGIAEICEPPSVFWELNPNPVEKQLVLASSLFCCLKPLPSHFCPGGTLRVFCLPAGQLHSH